MLEAIRTISEQEPKKIEYLNDGSYYYNYDRQPFESTNQEGETITSYCFVQIHAWGHPNYKTCIKEVIRKYLSEEKELGIINDYNSYQRGLIDAGEAVTNYNEYLQLLKDIKTNIYSDFGIEVQHNSVSIPRQVDVINLLKISINTFNLTDEEALEAKSFYPEWETFIGKSLSTGMKVVYEDRLYKVKQDISTVLENQFPSVDTAALYEEINEQHEGTLEDPIPYNNNMELFVDKYYIQNDIIYRCTRSTGQAVYHNLSDLVGIYVEQVQ